MLTVIEKDGTEVVIGDRSAPALIRHGKNDLTVVIYRYDLSAWVLGPLTSLRKGDCFRKLDTAESNDKVYLVTRDPVLHKNRLEPDAPTVYFHGLDVRRLTDLPPAKQVQLPGYSKPMLSSHNRLLLDYTC